MARSKKPDIAAASGLGVDLVLLVLERTGKNTPLLTVVLVVAAGVSFAYAALNLPWVTRKEGFTRITRGALAVVLITSASIWFAWWNWPEPSVDLRFAGFSKLYPYGENGRARLRVDITNDSVRELGYHFVYMVLIIPNGRPKTAAQQRENEEKAWKVFMAGDNLGREHDPEELKLAGKSSSSLFMDVSVSKEQADSMNAKTGEAHFMGVIVPTDPAELLDEYCVSNFGDLELLLSCAKHNGPTLP